MRKTPFQLFSTKKNFDQSVILVDKLAKCTVPLKMNGNKKNQICQLFTIAHQLSYPRRIVRLAISFFFSRKNNFNFTLYLWLHKKKPPYDLVFCDKTPIASHPDVKHTYIVKLEWKKMHTVTYIRIPSHR